MLQSIIDLLTENGINIQINEKLFAYGFIIFIVFLIVMALITQWGMVKNAIKQIVSGLFKEFKYDEESLGIFYDTIVEKVKVKLKTPDKDGKVPKINKWICFFLSLPITKGMVVKQIKYYLDEIVKKCQEEGIDVNKVLEKDEAFEVPSIK